VFALAVRVSASARRPTLRRRPDRWREYVFGVIVRGYLHYLRPRSGCGSVIGCPFDRAFAGERRLSAGPRTLDR